MAGDPDDENVGRCRFCCHQCGTPAVPPVHSAPSPALTPTSSPTPRRSRWTFLTGSGKSLQYRVFAINGAGHRSLPSSESSQNTGDLRHDPGDETRSKTSYSCGLGQQKLRPKPTRITTMKLTCLGTNRPTVALQPPTGSTWPKPSRCTPGMPPAIRSLRPPRVASWLGWRKSRDTRHSDPTYDHRGWRPEPACPRLSTTASSRRTVA